MKKIPVTCLLIAITAFVNAASSYQFSIDLNRADSNSLRVELMVPAITVSEITYHIPAIVPGTYTVFNFGRFISDFEAYDRQNKKLPVTRSGVNTWKIAEARSLYRISYRFHKTFRPDSSEVFEPAGIDIGKNIFQLNPHAFMGYFGGMKKLPYEWKVKKVPGLYGSTSMIQSGTQADEDLFTARSFEEMADAPVLYCVPDTVHLRIGQTDILVSVYHPNGEKYARQLADSIRPVLEMYDTYLNGLPVKKYAFLIYLEKKGLKAEGALEHGLSSVYYLRDRSSIYGIREMAAHEFYHIITPLLLHSEKISDFNFDEADMSQHLWLYEGVTEYTSGYIQLRYGLKPLKKYADNLQLNMFLADKYNDSLPFTVMSREVLKYADQYQNVYVKGALIAICLDIQLRYYSQGTRGLQDVMNALLKKYNNKSFKEDELFDAITNETYPQIGVFLRKYVAGPEPLPFKEVFDMVGINFTKNYRWKEFSIGGFASSLTDAPGDTAHDGFLFIISDTTSLNAFGKTLGYHQWDVLDQINGLPYTVKNRTRVFAGMKEGDMLTVVVLRKNASGEQEKVTLSAPVFMVEKTQKFLVEVNEHPTAAQLKIRNSWTNSR